MYLTLLDKEKISLRGLNNSYSSFVIT